jgi:Na+/H+-dicarboxylate symporter
MATGSHKLSVQIVVAMVLAILAGALARLWLPADGVVAQVLIDGAFDSLGQIFIRSLQLLVVPLVFVSLVCGTSSLTDIRQLGRIGVKTVSMYLLTTALAISLAISLGLLFDPGLGVALQAEAFEIKPSPSLWQVLIEIMPKNPVAAMAEGQMLQLILFSVLLGIAISQSGEAGQRLNAVFEDWNTVILKLVHIRILLAPYGVFCLLTGVVFELGLDAIAPLAKYFGVVLLALMVQLLVVYPSLFALLVRANPLQFLTKMRSAWLFAFSTASSNATLPITLATVRERLGVSNRIAAFSVPLGATINMDGTAIMQGVATVFIAQVYGIDLSLAQILTVILTATLASIGTAGVPGVGLIMLTLVLQQVGLPVEGIAMIIGIDRLLDMTRTAVNITGDAAVACIVGHSEQEMDRRVFENPKAGVE